MKTFRHLFDRSKRSLTLVKFAALLVCVLGFIGCGGEENSSGSAGQNDMPSPPPVSTPMPINNAAKVTAILEASRRFSFDENYDVFTDAKAADATATEYGNPGKNIGEQRLYAFKYALGILASQLAIPQTIAITFTDREYDNCYFYASADYQASWRGGNLPLPNTLYPSALASQILGVDTSRSDADIWVSFNKKHFGAECGTNIFLGFEPQSSSANAVDFIRLMMHEVLHGMGFALRPNSNSPPFIYERFLWAKDQQHMFSDLTESQRSSAADKVDNIVFSGRLTRKSAEKIWDNKITVTASSHGQTLDLPEILSNVAASRAFPETAIRGLVSVANFDTCEFESDVKNKIVLFPGGCARREFGFSGQQYNALIKAQEGGALAAVTNAEKTERRIAYMGVTIPVVTLPLEDYKTFVQKAADNETLNFTLQKVSSSYSGVDALLRPIVHTGENISELSRLVHFSPRTQGKPVNSKTGRSLMDAELGGGLEPGHRNINDALPALIDMGWSVKSCGNGKVDEFEECDDGDQIGGADCSHNCLLPGYCGDGVVDSLTEECDRGANNSDTLPNGCSSICKQY